MCCEVCFLTNEEKGFANGLVDGFTGFVMLPYHGARDGPSGFLKGFGKGTAGLALKPAAGK